MVRCMALVSNGMLILVLALLYRNNRGPLFFAFALFGFTTLPLLPLVIENCAEISYPIPEFISYGLVVMLNNVFSLIFTFVFQVLIQVDRFAPRPLTAINIGMYLIYFSLTVTIFFGYQGKQLRVGLDNALSTSDMKTSAPPSATVEAKEGSLSASTSADLDMIQVDTNA